MGNLTACVIVSEQRMRVFSGDEQIADFPVSTSAKGIDAREGSGGTPPGWHRVRELIGDGAPEGAVFVSREPTGEVLSPEERRHGGGDRILTRILWLEGLEPGVNAGPGIDSHERYIYIHGTNDEDGLGTPCSHGCIRVGTADLLRLFDLVRENADGFRLQVRQ